MAGTIRTEYAGAAYHAMAPGSQGRSGSYSGEPKWAYGEAQAERLLARGLIALELERGSTGRDVEADREKKAMGWWLCQHTTAARFTKRAAFADAVGRVTGAALRRRARRLRISILERSMIYYGSIMDLLWIYQGSIRELSRN